MKNFMSNIKVKLIFALVMILIIPAIIIGYLSYSTAKDAVEEEAIHGIEQNIGLLNTTINSTLQPKMMDMEYFAKTVNAEVYQDENSPELRAHLDEYIQIHPEAASIYLGTKTGLYIQEPRVTDTTKYDPRKRDWYKQAVENQGETIITAPYADAGTKEMVITVAKTTDDGHGVMAVDISLAQLQKMTNQVKIGEKGYAFLLDEDKKVIAHPTLEGGTEVTEEFFNDMYKKEQGTFAYSIDNENKIMSFITNDLTGWKIAGTLYMAELDKAAAPIFQKTLLIITISFVIGAGAIFFIIKSIMKPINDLKEHAITISKGDLTQNIKIKTKDEIGQLGLAFNEMLESLRNVVKKVRDNSIQVSASAEQLTAGAEQTTDAAEQVSHAIQEVAGSSEKQTSGVEETARALDEIAHGVTIITDSSIKVSGLSRHTMQQAEIGGTAVANTVTQMKSISESVTESNAMMATLNEHSKEISSILNVITAIADQTNLLSLNAAIEAARAGEHGKGFSVVAEEVRKLAEQSQQAVKEIDVIIQRIQSETETAVQKMARVNEDVKTGVQISNEAIERFEQILQGTKEIVPQMEEVSATTEQIAASIQELTATTNDLSSIAQENAAASEEVAASTEEQLASMEEIAASAGALSKMAEELAQSISQFKY
ncbi:methyl-accepting chemotaxis protein [Bacillus benzoevorans]|uniref:Methyl-accepting chemotaxis protein n=2 Tax=Bacillus benzoevorans TaxID=1456 RepID=A0A7X0HQN2_9BACI|nr:methyl-accepting chemotaxis protein [Bacillus benzoevorans]MBB6445163.1 methyl-accepting chemotaxis protein [Bacillus benzoevorans]